MRSLFFCQALCMIYSRKRHLLLLKKKDIQQDMRIESIFEHQLRRPYFEYLGANKREDAMIRNNAGQKIKYKLSHRSSQIEKLSKSGQYAANKVEHATSSVRAKAEHVFGIVKRQLRFRKTRYGRLDKQRAKFHIILSLRLTDPVWQLAFVRFCSRKCMGYPQMIAL